jgi:hypothetical protein
VNLDAVGDGSAAQQELTTGRRVVGDTKPEAGRWFIVFPPFMRKDLERQLKWFAEKEPEGLLCVREPGVSFRRSSFGRKLRRARLKVGLPENFRLSDLRHTDHTPATQSGATLKVRAGPDKKKGPGH